MNFCLSIFMLVFVCNNAFSIQKGVYGTDNRKEVYEIGDLYKQEQSLSVAAHISADQLKLVDGHYQVATKVLGDRYPLCSDENYKTQFSIANCTGFLVAPNVLVTAGHCMVGSDACTGMKWVFDFQEGIFNAKNIPSENVYSCKKVLGQKLDSKTLNDFAVVQLDRNVEDRAPLPYRKYGKVRNYTSVYVMGHPSGLPLKIADDAHVYLNDDDYFFKADLDTFGGNSGSPIFSDETGEVEGILVRGDRDYVFDKNRNCLMVNHCSAISLECTADGVKACEGESATRITQVPLSVYVLLAGNRL